MGDGWLPCFVYCANILDSIVRFKGYFDEIVKRLFRITASAIIVNCC